MPTLWALTFTLFTLITTLPGIAAPIVYSTNSLGMRLIEIMPGSFEMGAETNVFDLGPKTAESKDAPSWDETPHHEVHLTKSFRLGEEPVTTKQFQQFQPGFQSAGGFADYATGVSYNDAVAFCNWLSQKEGKPCRLPTEAEWEYACRAGTSTLFWSGDAPPKDDVNPWGLRRMQSGLPQWCFDWHGEYPAGAQTDPVGYDAGWARIVRGGASHTLKIKGANGEDVVTLDLSPVWFRSANRCGLMPDTPKFDPAHPCHFIGFRIVEGDLPKTAPLNFIPELPLQGVKQASADWSMAPNPREPYFKARVIIPSPPDFVSDTQCAAVGFDRAMQGKVHSGGITFCPNGDLLAISFSSSLSKSESAPNTCMVITRLRRGAEEWDMPELFYKMPGLNDQSGLLWNDHGTIWFFGGGRDFGEVPFRFTQSRDSGATWSELHPAVVVGKTGAFLSQPINSAFRGPDGTIYVGTDSRGAHSLLWASSDEGKTWRDTGGRTVGRHTTFVLLNDGRVLGMGGKDSAIERYMPRCFSSDFGQTWTPAEKTPFAGLGSNQRPKILRLASGKLFFAGDFQNIRMVSAPPPDDIKERGSYVALSDDEGKTWHTKKLALATPHNGWHGVVPKTGKPQHGFGTLGYCDAVQAPDGLIHLMTSKGAPSMHFAMNESWILSNETGEANQATSPAGKQLVKVYDRSPSRKLRVLSTYFLADNGTMVLQGYEVWYDGNEKKQYEVTRDNGKKIGLEKYFRPDGSVQWTRDYQADGNMTWTTYWPGGAKKSESHWHGPLAQGVTTIWDADGKLLQTFTFKDGRDLAASPNNANDD